MLASATFTSETTTGWQQVQFSSPVAVTANTTYVASYHTDTGYYSSDFNYFATVGFDNGPLHALSQPVGGSNGLYRYGASAFPNKASMPPTIGFVVFEPDCPRYDAAHGG